MSPKKKKWLKFALRWGIAAAGIFYVVKNLSLYDQVMVRAPDGRPALVRLARPAAETDHKFTIFDTVSKPGETVIREVDRTNLLTRPDRDQATIVDESTGAKKRVDILALMVHDNPNVTTWPLIVDKPRNIVMKYFNITHGEPATVVEPKQIDPGDHYDVRVPYPLIDRGLIGMVREAQPSYLWAAVLIFPLTFLITSWRWHDLLKALDIHMGMAKAFKINMVGAFYNTFMPGSTGGDVLKAYYATKAAPGRRTRAVMSVLVDRALGLLALIMMGGAAAGFQYWQYAKAGQANDATARACIKVAAVSAVLIVGVVIGSIVFFNPFLRRITGLNFLLVRMPMQAQIQKAIEAMEIYRARPWLVIYALLISFPVHATVVTSAMLAGIALRLPLDVRYYWVVVPVAVLAASIPISPQGAGVMEFFTILLTRRQGCTIGHAFALTMSIRLVQILWNLVGGIFVFRGGYHAPTEKEKKSLEDETPAGAALEMGPSPGQP